MIKIAYWDNSGSSRPPRLLGEIKGTPTIRLFKPKRKQSKEGSNAEKSVLDYNGERKAKDMKTFLEYSMPNYADRIVFPQELQTKSLPKAAKYGLSTAIVFPSKPKTSSIIKFLSTLFRRRLVMVEIVPNDANRKELYSKYGISSKEELPVLVIVNPEEGEEKYIRYEGTDFSRRKLERFLSEHAQKKPVYKQIIPKEEEEEESSSSKPKVHTEF